MDFEHGIKFHECNTLRDVTTGYVTDELPTRARLIGWHGYQLIHTSLLPTFV